MERGNTGRGQAVLEGSGISDWWKKENETVPGNPLSRLPKYHAFQEPDDTDLAPYLADRLNELLVEIDREALAGDCLDARYDGILAENQKLRAERAESYAPCRECGDAPYKGPTGWCCLNCHTNVRYPDKAAWNFAQHKEG